MYLDVDGSQLMYLDVADLQLMKMKKKKIKFVIFKCYSSEEPSRGCPHLVLISQLSRLKQCR